jgi:KDO2-lipid IV(A) lauroyltransferase
VERPLTRPGHFVEEGLVRATLAFARSRPWPECLAFGARLGDLARALRIRRRVAAEQLAAAFPERTPLERERILIEHYRELGRVWVEYAHMPELMRRPLEEVAVTVRGAEHLQAAADAGHGLILLTGHFSNFEMFAALTARRNGTDAVVKPMSNPRVDRLIDGLRRSVGLGTIPIGSARGLIAALRAGRWLAMAGDQDARRQGVFVPFFGRPASTAPGAARMSILTGAPIVMGFIARRADGRVDLEYEPPMTAPDPRGPDAVRELTARHAARLEVWIRRRPEMWFWLHRRWKTQPRAGEETR